MKLSEVAARVVEEKSAWLVRERGGKGQGLRVTPAPILYDARPYAGGGRKRGWTVIDLFTAGAVVVVHAALNPENQDKLDSLVLRREIDVVWKLVKASGGRA